MTVPNQKKKISIKEKEDVIKKTVLLLQFLRKKRFANEINELLGTKTRETNQWLEFVSEHAPIVKRNYESTKTWYCLEEFLPDTYPKPKIANYTLFKTLDGCLYTLGATRNEIKKSKNEMSTLDYKRWVDLLFLECIRKHDINKSPPEMISAYNEARDKAHHILEYRRNLH